MAEPIRKAMPEPIRKFEADKTEWDNIAGTEEFKEILKLVK